MKASIRRTLGTTAVTAGLLGFGLAGAAAHVTIEADQTAAGAYSTLTVAFSHDCGGSPTNQLTISLPEQMIDAKPEIKAGWNVEKVVETLDEPMTLENGSSVTERVGKIVYTAETPIEDGYLASFDLSVQLPDAAGETLAFPVLQTCEDGETDWAQIPAEGEDPHSLDTPAPTIELTEAGAEGGHGEAAVDADVASASGDSGASSSELENASASTATSGATAGYVGLGAGLLGLAAGGTALLRTRKTRA